MGEFVRIDFVASTISRSDRDHRLPKRIGRRSKRHCRRALPTRELVGHEGLQFIEVAQRNHEDVAAGGDAMKRDRAEDLAHVFHLGQLLAALLLGRVRPHREVLAGQLSPRRTAKTGNSWNRCKAGGEQQRQDQKMGTLFHLFRFSIPNLANLHTAHLG